MEGPVIEVVAGPFSFLWIGSARAAARSAVPAREAGTRQAAQPGARAAGWSRAPPLLGSPAPRPIRETREAPAAPHPELDQAVPGEGLLIVRGVGSGNPLLS